MRRRYLLFADNVLFAYSATYNAIVNSNDRQTSPMKSPYVGSTLTRLHIAPS